VASRLSSKTFSDVKDSREEALAGFRDLVAANLGHIVVR